MKCYKCLTDQPETQFSPVKRKYAVRERHHWCKTCRAAYSREYRKKWAAANPEKLAARKRKERLRLYGLDSFAFNELFNKQAGACAICQCKFDDNLHVDHCHTTGQVRGLLCPTCNRGIGHFNDDIELMLRAVSYLQGTK